MDTTDPLITFDTSGFCNHCSDFIDNRSKHAYLGSKSDEQLNQLVAKIKKSGRKRKYDCIVGLSGGMDSCYAAYIAKSKGLRVLAVHMDNGWNSEEAVLNIRNIAKTLDIDYESYVLNWEVFRDLQLSFLKASVPEAETPTDIAILSALHKVASKYRVKYIISGGNFATEGILPKSWHYDAKDLKFFNAIHHKFGQLKSRGFPTFGFLREMYCKFIKGIQMIYLLNYIEYDKDVTINLLTEKLNWKAYRGKHYESKYTSFIQSYYLYTKFNIDYRKATFSSQICLGSMDREVALKILAEKPYNSEIIEQEKKYIAKKLTISLDDFEAILKYPPKFYWNYPNDEQRLNFIYNTYRKLFKKEKLGSF
jgi:N-acetyl sugar amidotransferase